MVITRFGSLILSLVLGFTTLQAQEYTPTQANLAARQAFQDMKFGLFVHWGASSVLGHGEWVMNNRNIHVKDYQKLQHLFNPQQFDADAWVAMAKNAGMKYITFITRHHDGFSNWDTKFSDWKVTNTPYGKDILKQLSEACQRQGVQLFLYYSILDWSRDDYQYATGKTGKGTARTHSEPWENYIGFMKNQFTELLTQYGPISGIWLDGHWDQLDNDHDKTLPSKVDWHYNELYTLVHSLQPACLIGNNHHLSPIPGEDFQMFEKDLPGQNTTGFGGADISSLPLESCETMNDSWGFNITDHNYKSSKKLIQYLVNAAGRNANFLLNVGPMPDGTIQQEFKDTLAVMGQWMAQHGESIYGTRGNVYPPAEWGVMTRKSNELFVHILKKPGQNFLFLPAFTEKVTKMTTFASKKDVRFQTQKEGTFIYLDGVPMDAIDTIIRVVLAKE
ncbi:MAG: alpha-L-fucosidase [Saprospiraceae bacterium]|jgi:alpha-L-fucosidase|nr:alpha-L-fucosidase [Saprospiraceae bacterium]